MFSSNTSQVSEDRLYVEDVFSTYLYSGSSGAQSINNGIDTLNKGGLVWLKNRTSSLSNILLDTGLGCTFSGGSNLISNSTNAAGTIAANTFKFDSTGFSFGSAATGTGINGSGSNYVSWTFRKAPKFFDVVTWTGNGVNGRTIAHALGTTPGCIIYKCTSTTADWLVLHRSLPNGFSDAMTLNTTDASFSLGSSFAPTATTFTMSNGVTWNQSGQTYVAYLFAHDTTSDGIIQCGSYTGTGSPVTVNLGWEPQWVLIKRTDTAAQWLMADNMRGLPVSGDASFLNPNTSGAEFTFGSNVISPTATGFGSSFLTSGTYIYIAIRRGPMRTPTTGTSVFSPNATSVNPNTAYTTNFPVDLIMMRPRSGTSTTYAGSRLTGNGTYLQTSSTAAETAYSPSWYFDLTTGTMASNLFTSNQNYINWNFRRAPSFMDVVCYTGTGSSRTVNHNLGVVPEMIIVKSRTQAGTYWMVQQAALGPTKDIYLQLTNAASTRTAPWNDTAPTSTVFTVGTDSDTNGSGQNFVAYLFASCPGVSKVGSYTGNGSSQTINCGFSGGARFFLVKRTDSTGDWWVYDSARGIVAAADPALRLNSTAAEVTSADAVDTASSGIIVNQESTCNINVNNATYIYLAIS